MGIKFLTKEEVQDVAKGALGKTFKDLADKDFKKVLHWVIY